MLMHPLGLRIFSKNICLALSINFSFEPVGYYSIEGFYFTCLCTLQNPPSLSIHLHPYSKLFFLTPAFNFLVEFYC